MRWLRRRTPTPPTPPPLRVRPMRPDDGGHLDEVFAGMSAHSRYQRFHAPVRVLSPAMRTALLGLDGRTHVAFVAEACDGDGWRAVGVSRFVRTAPGEAELAVEVVDAWQGRGVGRQLLAALAARAEELGYHTLDAEVLLDNQAVLALLQRTFPGARLEPCGTTGTVHCPLPRTRDPFERAAAAWAPALTR